MKCTIKGCSGEYKDGHIAHTVSQNGKVVFKDNVSAEVCSVCGDFLLKPEFVRSVGRPKLTESKSIKKCIGFTPGLMKRIQADPRIRDGVPLSVFIANAVEAYIKK